uniref:DUF5681 domain-containing protein n=1 Tax=Loa loa TaxID=7209 RepID=A0A1I7VF88_LOALO
MSSGNPRGKPRRNGSIPDKLDFTINRLFDIDHYLKKKVLEIKVKKENEKRKSFLRKVKERTDRWMTATKQEIDPN